MKLLKAAASAALILLCDTVSAGGSDYVVQPGHLQNFAGQIAQWPVPTPRFARDPAPGPDGNIYIAVMQGNRIARFDVKTETFEEWELPPGAHPHGLIVDAKGKVWYTGNGNGTIGELDPATGEVTEHRLPSGGGPHTLIADEQGVIWFTVQRGNRIGRLDPASGEITEYQTSGGPYGIALDKSGSVWFCRMGEDRLGRLDPVTGKMTELVLEPGSQPRRMAASPDGSLWVTLYGTGKLIRVDPQAGRVVKEYSMPGGAKSGPYAVTVDGAGIVYANEIATDTVVRLDPASGEMRTIELPMPNTGIRKMIVDAEGRLWYMGSHNGQLGVIE